MCFVFDHFRDPACGQFTSSSVFSVKSNLLIDPHGPIVEYRFDLHGDVFEVMQFSFQLNSVYLIVLSKSLKCRFLITDSSQRFSQVSGKNLRCNKVISGLKNDKNDRFQLGLNLDSC